MVRDALEELVVGSTQIVPKDWESWIAAIEEKPDWAQALDVAQSACSEWPVDIYRNDPGRVRRLAERLHALTPAVLETVRYALPHLTRFFLDEGGSNFVFEPIYRSILLLLAVDSKFGSEDWLLTQNLTTAVFDAGPGADAYTDVVEALTAVWQSRGEVARLDWALDQLDTLVLVPAVVPAKRDDFFGSVWQTFTSHSRRISKSHIDLFRLLCADLGRSDEFAALSAPALAEPGGEVQEVPTLDGKIIGIYTLTEAVGLRAKALIERQFAGARVRLNHDLVGNPRLESLAKESDFMLVVAKSAKHAATDFIKQKRPRGKSDLIYPSGKGSSSIMTALMGAIGCGT
jgi:hypothetical protein